MATWQIVRVVSEPGGFRAIMRYSRPRGKIALKTIAKADIRKFMIVDFFAYCNIKETNPHIF